MKSLQLAKPHLLMMVGIPGSGKSSFAEKFSDMFGAPCVSDGAIKPYVLDESGLRHVMNTQIKELLKTHQTLIVDGGTDARTERAELARMARAAGYELLLVWVQTDPATAKSRALKTSRGMDGEPLSSSDYDKLLQRFTAPNATEKPVVISGKHTYATQTKVILKKLTAPRAAISVHTNPPARPTDQPTRRNITIR